MTVYNLEQKQRRVVFHDTYNIEKRHEAKENHEFDFVPFYHIMHRLLGQ